MMSAAEDLRLLLVILGSALAFMLVLNHLWPPERRRVHNDLVGWQLSVLGTTYAVILGFMLYTVWTEYTAATLNVDLEASAVVNVHRLADGLPPEQRDNLQRLAFTYAETVATQDWPEMDQSRPPDASMRLNARMWRVLMSVKAASAAEITAEDHALSELSILTEHRRTRVLQSSARLPGVLWCVLIVGGAMTVVTSCLFGVASRGLHLLQVLALTLLISLVLVAIADIHRPFQGAVHVSDLAFRRALQNMQNE